MDDLKKEFDQFLNRSKDDSCDIDGREDEYEEEYPDYVMELTTIMLVPDRCGVYFSKKDFRAIGLENELSISLKQRVRMLTDLLKSIFTLEEMNKMFNSFRKIIDERIAIYNEMSENYPSTKEHFKEWIDKANSLKKRLDRIEKESSGEA